MKNRIRRIFYSELQLTNRRIFHALDEHECSNKLNLAAGEISIDGFTNVDITNYDGIDIVTNLLEFPWTWANDNEYDFIYVSHFMEHITTGGFVDEMIRICKDGAFIEIHVPHPVHSPMMHVPEHVRKVSLDTFKKWIIEGSLTLYDTGVIKHFNLWKINDYHWRKYITKNREFGFTKQLYLIFEVKK